MKQHKLIWNITTNWSGLKQYKFDLEWNKYKGWSGLKQSKDGTEKNEKDNMEWICKLCANYSNITKQTDSTLLT